MRQGMGKASIYLNYLGLNGGAVSLMRTRLWQAHVSLGSDSWNRTYIITTRRITLGDELK